MECFLFGECSSKFVKSSTKFESLVKQAATKVIVKENKKIYKRLFTKYTLFLTNEGLETVDNPKP
jgi:hypothetical protein